MLKFGTLLLLIIGIAYAFTPNEVEIFQMQAELVKKYGDGMDFYKFLKLPKLRASTSKEIGKNLRNLSKKYHPDRNKKYKKLYESLNIVTKILSDDSRRKTYDYYLKNGFPDYNYSKGGFFFKRVQPKTWFIIFFIYVVTSIIHYCLLILQNNSNKKRIDSFIKQCKENDDTNGLGEKKLSFKQHADAEPKNILITFGDVYVVEESGKKSLISTDTIQGPSVFDTLFFKLPLSLWNFTLGRFFNKDDLESLGTDEEEDDLASTEQSAKAVKKSKKKKSTPVEGQKKMVLPNGKVIYSRKKD